MRRPVVYAARSERSSPMWARAFARGAGGLEVRYEEDWEVRTPVAMFGSPYFWDTLQAAIEGGRTWWYGDHGYFGRLQYYRCTRDAYQINTLPTVRQDERRLERLKVGIKPWRTTGDHVLVCPPTPKHALLHGFSASDWLDEAVRELKQHTDRRIIVRHRTEPRPLEGQLAGAWALVTYTSNAAVDALMEGVPVFCNGPCPGRAAGRDDLTRIEDPRMDVDRRQFAAYLANNQWTLAEMKRGMLWRSIGIAEQPRPIRRPPRWGS